MSNPNGRRGAGWEARLVAYFNEAKTFFGEVFRAPRWGTKDKGDLVNTKDFVVQAKAVKAITLASFMDEVREQKSHAGKRWGVCIIKRKSHGTGRAYVVMELDDFADLVAAYYGKEAA